MPTYRSGGNANRQSSFPSQRDEWGEIPLCVKKFLSEATPEGSRNALLFFCAAQLRDQGRPENVVLNILLERALANGTSEAEVRKTISSAFTRPARGPAQNPHTGREFKPGGHRTYKRGGATSSPPPRPEAPKPFDFDTTKEREIPAPMENGTLHYLQAMFPNAEERIFAVAANNLVNSDGKVKEVPDDSTSCTMARKQWEDELQLRRMGCASKPVTYFYDGGHGVYVCINPITGDQRKTENIERFTHGLLEFDSGELETQLSVIRQSRIPCTAIVYSGGRSIHALVKVDAPNLEVFRGRMNYVYARFVKYNPDSGCKDATRLSRLPGFTRGDPDYAGNPQTLLALNVGCKDWPEWLNYLDENERKRDQPEGEKETKDTSDDLPPIEDFCDLDPTQLELPGEVIEGVLYGKCKMVIAGSSKSKKTFALMDLAVSIASGREWWGLKTTKGKTLYIDLELGKRFAYRRLTNIMKKREIEMERDCLHVLSLRGFCRSFEQLKAKILRRISGAKYMAVIIDPIYKVLGGRDENRASDIADLLNQIEQLAEQSGAAVIIASHYSKGGQANKEPMDRISGSGVFARDPDSILLLTQHEEQNSFTVESVLRHHAPIDPFVVTWEYPVLKRNNDLSPEDLKGTEHQTTKKGQSKMPMPSFEEWVSNFSEDFPPGRPLECMLTKVMIENECRANIWNLDTVRAYIDRAIQQGLLDRYYEAAAKKVWIGRPVVIRAYAKQQAEERAAKKKAGVL